MLRRRRNILTAGIVLVLLAVGAWGWWYLRVGRFPLAGNFSHDYGIIPIYGRSAGAAHTFDLRNRTGETLTIEKIIPGCGCAEVIASTRMLEPGEHVELSVTLTLSRSGEKKTTVELVLGDAGVQTLWIRGTGRRELSLWSTQQQIMLTPGESTPLHLIAEVASTDEMPAPPTIVAPEGVSVEFLRWERIEKRDARKQWAARWRGRFRITLDTDALPDDAQLLLSLGESQPIAIALRQPRSPNPASPEPEE
jgi:hypothetical protein